MSLESRIAAVVTAIAIDIKSLFWGLGQKADINDPSFTGQVIVPEGTRLAPGLAFANDGAPDTGFFHIADGVFGIACNTEHVASFRPEAVDFHRPLVFSPSGSAETMRTIGVNGGRSFGTFWRNDGANYYLMVTAANDPYGTWTGQRPFTVNLETGVGFTNGNLRLDIGGAVRGQVKSEKTGQTRWSQAGLVSASADSDAMVAFHANGANTAAVIRHKRGGNGVQVEDAPGALANLIARMLNGYKDGQTDYLQAGLQSTSKTGDVLITLHADGSSAAVIRHVRGVAGVRVHDAAGALAPITVSNAFVDVLFGRVVTQGSEAQRFIAGQYGTFWRNDGNGLYLMVTAANDQWGPWTDARPLIVNLATGVASINGNAATASKLLTPASINDVPFDGTQPITIRDNTKFPLTGGGVNGLIVAFKNDQNDWGSAGLRSESANGPAMVALHAPSGSSVAVIKHMPGQNGVYVVDGAQALAPIRGSTLHGAQVWANELYGRVITQGDEAQRIVQGNYGTFWRQDGSTLYLMVTASGDAWGSWTGQRPLAVDLASGVANINGNANTANRFLNNTTDLVIAKRNGQTNYANAGVRSESDTGDAIVSMHCAGASALSMRHVRGVPGVRVEDAAGSLAPVTASAFVSTYIDATQTTVLAAGGTKVFSNFSGMLVVNSISGGAGMKLFLCGGGTVTESLSHGANQAYTVAHNPGSDGYVITNTSGTALVLGIFAVRTRPAA
ncbi:hypothetical protein [Comamonas antarctica]|uniref:phage tail fiber protein n=1 Tax=Comamonas antarctica TaxID=2743470 RepID=UPI0028EE2DC9|nr:hypothetical protein [Comamonas antarctica]